MPDLTGFNRSKERRRAPRRTTAPDVISDTQHMYQCDKRLMSGEPCTRVIGPYYNLTLYREALAQHLAAQHVNTLSSMTMPEKADLRMWFADSDVKDPGYVPPTW